MTTTDTEVLIVGAGPVGLMLAGELRLHGIDCLVLERSTEPTDQSRALGFTSRTIEVFDQRGLLPRFGPFDQIPIGHFGGIQLDYTEAPGGSYGAKGVPQSLTARILQDWASENGADIRRGWDVTGLTAGDDGVDVEVDGPAGPVRVRAAYVVGCDGGRSTVRSRAGIDFPGHDAAMALSFAEVGGVRVRPRPNGERVPNGLVLAFQQGPEDFRVTYYEQGVVPRRGDEPPSFEEVAGAWLRLTGEDIHAGTPRWIGRFTDASRQAAEYRRGRVLLAGDAAHIHLPIAGQGMSTGIQDAVNLGWKLAAEVRGTAPDGLLDSYHAERHPVGAAVISNTLAQRILYVGGDEIDPLRSLFTELTGFAPARVGLINTVTGLEIRYDLGEPGRASGPDGDHPLVGRRLPDRRTADGRTTFQLLHRGRGVLLLPAGPGPFAAAATAWRDRVDVVPVRLLPAGPGEGEDRLAGLDAVLVRPDGYVAWVAGAGSGGGGTGAGSDTAGLTAALTRWFGAARAEPVEATQPADRLVALVTGGNKGIGVEVVRQLAELGATVLLGARNEGRGKEAADTLAAAGLDVVPLVLEVTDAASVDRAAAEIEERYGRLDILVNNAGTAGDFTGPPSDARGEDLSAVYATNVFGVVSVTSAMLPLLRRSRAGRIVNLSSAAGSLTLNSGPAFADYNAIAYQSSKTALNAITLAYAKELRACGILVNAANPGFVKTDLNGGRGHRTPEEGARVVVRLATLGPDGPSGTSQSDDGTVPW